MHTTTTNNVSFIHNGDYSGEIFIVGKDRDGSDSEVVVKMEDLKGFLMKTLREELTSTLEKANSTELMRIAMQLGVTFP